MTFIQSLIDGLGKGSTYALLAIGVSLVFGVMHLVNFAHGELLTVGAYAIFVLRHHNVPWPVAVAVAICLAIIASVLIEFVAFRRVRGASPFTMLLTSFAVEILSHTIFRSIYGQNRRSYPTPKIAFQVWNIGGLKVSVWSLISIGVAIVVFSGTAFLLRSTMLGLSIRASAEDFDAARLMGVRANRVISSAFALAGLLAGIAGALSWLKAGVAEPAMGSAPLLKAVVAALIGGMGSLPGAVVGGLSLGVAEVLFSSLLPSGMTRLSDTFVFAIIAALFVVRPQGLFNVASAERV